LLGRVAKSRRHPYIARMLVDRARGLAAEADFRSEWSLVGTCLAVTAIWGFNFVVIKVGTDHVPPLLLAALRFTFVALPAIAFVRRPSAPPIRVAAYGLFLGVGEFGLLFTAMMLGAPAGLSSLILQSQAFFTALLAASFLQEPFPWHGKLGLSIAASGLAVIGWRDNQPGACDGHFALALAMLLAAALMWAVANVLARRIGSVGGLSLVVWSSLASPLPLALLSVFIEGPRAIGEALGSLSWTVVGAIVYLVVLSTLFGYGAWNHLIVRHGAARVAPFSMLVPLFGVASGAVLLGEVFTEWHAVAAVLVLLGLALHALGGRLFACRR
jgi:O-acetylserine/cysteine efflux transporter